jgi:putative spermidine/putrescine transport system permease protein
MLLEFRSMGSFRYVLYTVTGAIVAFLILPIVFIIALSFGSSRWLQFPPPEWTLRWYRELFERSEWLDAIITSLQVGVCVTVLSLLLGVPAAFAVVRGRFPGRDLLNAFFTTPLIVPLVIIGIAIYGLYLSWGLAGTFIGFVLGHLILAIPFAVITTSNALRSFDESIEKAAIVCGATRAQALWRVTLPGIRSGIVAGGLFSFLISWDEVVLAIFMSSSSVQTLPVKMWSALRLDLSPIIAAAASLLVLLTVVLLALVAIVQHYGEARAAQRQEEPRQ